MKVWDLGGQTNLRPFWSTYYQGTDAVIVVVDSTDRARLGMAKAELFHLLTHPHLAAAPVLVFANKQARLCRTCSPGPCSAAVRLLIDQCWSLIWLKGRLAKGHCRAACATGFILPMQRLRVVIHSNDCDTLSALSACSITQLKSILYHMAGRICAAL